MSTRAATNAERIPSGEAIAAFMAATIGLLALGLANVVQEANGAFFDPLWLQAGAWIPNYQDIGPYAGKETIACLSWLGSWASLHVALRGKHIRVKAWTLAMVAGVACAALLSWPPFGEFVRNLFEAG